MSNIITQTIEQISKEKNIDPKVIIEALEDAMVAASRKFYKTNEDINARFDPETGMVEIFAVKRVVETVENPALEISLEEAKQIDESLELDDTVEMPKPTDVLGRIAAQTAKQVILQKVREAERQNIYNDYSQKIGEMVNGVVKRLRRARHHRRHRENRGAPAAARAVPGRDLQAGRASPRGHRQGAPVSKGPQVILSRTDPQILHPALRDGNPGDLRRHDRGQERRSRAGRPGQGRCCLDGPGCGSGGRLRRNEGIAHQLHHPRTARGEDRHRAVVGRPGPLCGQRAQPGQDLQGADRRRQSRSGWKSSSRKSSSRSRSARKGRTCGWRPS